MLVRSGMRRFGRQAAFHADGIPRVEILLLLGAAAARDGTLAHTNQSQGVEKLSHVTIQSASFCAFLVQ